MYIVNRWQHTGYLNPKMRLQGRRLSVWILISKLLSTICFSLILAYLAVTHICRLNSLAAFFWSHYYCLPIFMVCRFNTPSIMLWIVGPTNTPTRMTWYLHTILVLRGQVLGMNLGVLMAACFRQLHLGY